MRLSNSLHTKLRQENVFWYVGIRDLAIGKIVTSVVLLVHCMFDTKLKIQQSHIHCHDYNCYQLQNLIICCECAFSAPTDFLLLSEKTDGRRDTQIKRVINSSLPDLVLPIRNLRIIKALEYDHIDHKIYWSMDFSKSRTVKRASINGTNVSFVYES